tara:strand:+ start:946 stop:1245 length:300 start_codon:yes stop_codon:yes gene_type:complete
MVLKDVWPRGDRVVGHKQQEVASDPYREARSKRGIIFARYQSRRSVRHYQAKTVVGTKRIDHAVIAPLNQFYSCKIGVVNRHRTATLVEKQNENRVSVG